MEKQINGGAEPVACSQRGCIGERTDVEHRQILTGARAQERVVRHHERGARSLDVIGSNGTGGTVEIVGKTGQLIGRDGTARNEDRLIRQREAAIGRGLQPELSGIRRDGQRSRAQRATRAEDHGPAVDGQAAAEAARTGKQEGSGAGFGQTAGPNEAAGENVGARRKVNRQRAGRIGHHACADQAGQSLALAAQIELGAIADRDTSGGREPVATAAEQKLARLQVGASRISTGPRKDQCAAARLDQGTSPAHRAADQGVGGTPDGQLSARCAVRNIAAQLEAAGVGHDRGIARQREMVRNGVGVG